MSYDFQFFIPVIGLTPQQIVNEVVQREVDYDAAPRPLSEEAMRRVSYIEAELLKYEPNPLHIAGAPDQITFTAMLQAENYIRISLDEYGGNAQISYSSSRTYYRAVWDYLLLLERVAGFYIIDCQSTTLLNLKTDFEASYRFYNKCSIRIFGKYG